MGRNILVFPGEPGFESTVARFAREQGSDLGLVLTQIPLQAEKVFGGRVEEDRLFGGVTFQTFDEPVFVGAAIAQLAGHADVVVLSDLKHWSERLLERFPDNDVDLQAELKSLRSVMQAGMTDLVLVTGTKTSPEDSAAGGALLRDLIRELEQSCSLVADAFPGELRWRKGSPAHG